jgi:predicted nucleotidyltransferase
MVENTAVAFGLTPSDLAVIQQTIAQFSEVKKAFIFGSRAKGTYERGSDVDIALMGNNLEKIVRSIHYQLEEETRLPYFFDVVDYSTLTNVDLKAHIDRVGKLIFERIPSVLEKE